MTAPWLEDRRYHRPDVHHTAGITYDDIKPTEADDRELKRALRAQNKVYEQAYRDGLESRPDPDPSDVLLHGAWQAGRWERNRRRQETVLRWLGLAGKRVAPKTTKRIRGWRKRFYGRRPGTS